LSVYRLPSPYEGAPLSRRVSGFGLALAINLALLFILLTLGVIPAPGQKASRGLTVDLIPESHSASQEHVQNTQTVRRPIEKPVPKPPRIVLPPVTPTITPPPKPATKSQPWIEMSHSELAAADISKLQSSGSGAVGDSEVVGKGPNGETLYAAEWARRPTDAEIGGYWPRHATGWGLVACKTIPGDRVDDCLELDQSPPGSHLASAVRQAAWQFRVRPPRRNGRELIGAWVRILIEIYPSEG
jgi:periplasmic protein TonB